MSDKYKVLGKFIKDMSSETPNTETYLFVKENISKYQLNIDINVVSNSNELSKSLIIFKDLNNLKNFLNRRFSFTGGICAT